MRARNYDANLGRFLQKDSFTGREGNVASRNLYIYCENDGVNKNDPTGHEPAPYTTKVKMIDFDTKGSKGYVYTWNTNYQDGMSSIGSQKMITFKNNKWGQKKIDRLKQSQNDSFDKMIDGVTIAIPLILALWSIGVTAASWVTRALTVADIGLLFVNIDVSYDLNAGDTLFQSRNTQGYRGCKTITFIFRITNRKGKIREYHKDVEPVP